jgi:hypothetical protein
MKRIARRTLLVSFLDLFFDLEGGDIFLRNVSWLSTDYMAVCPRRQDSSLVKTAAHTQEAQVPRIEKSANKGRSIQ